MESPWCVVRPSIAVCPYQNITAYNLKYGPSMRVARRHCYETPSGVTYHYANNNKLRYASWALRESVRSTRNTLVIAFHVGLARICLPMIARGGRLALFVHGIEIWRQLDRLETLATNFANTVISNSNYTLRQFAKHNRQIRLDNAHVCHLGTPSINPETSTNSDGHFALLVGRMASTEQYKGHDELIELWPDVVRICSPRFAFHCGRWGRSGKARAKNASI